MLVTVSPAAPPMRGSFDLPPRCSVTVARSSWVARPRLHGSRPGERMMKAAEKQSPAGAPRLAAAAARLVLKVRPIDDRDELLATAAQLEESTAPGRRARRLPGTPRRG